MDAQAGQCLCFSQTPEDRFSCVVAHMVCLNNCVGNDETQQWLILSIYSSFFTKQYLLQFSLEASLEKVSLNVFLKKSELINGKVTVKPVLSGDSKNRQNKDLNGKW